MISFNASREEHGFIEAIAKRAVKTARAWKVNYSRKNAEMDLTACHANGCPLDLAKLLAADDFTFSHDVFGIRRCLDRTTGRLVGLFLPRCAQKEKRPPSKEAVRDQIRRLLEVRRAFPNDRKVLAELDIQTAQLNGDRLEGRTPEEVESSQLAQRWLSGESDIEPAAHWEELARLWTVRKERGAELAKHLPARKEGGQS